NVVRSSSGADLMLAQLAQEIDQRYAREKRAYHAALVLLRKPSHAETPEIRQRARPDMTVAVQPFVANRYDFVEKFRAEARAASSMLTQAGLVAAGEPSCALIDPLSDDEGRLEAIVPVTTPARIPQGLTLRQLPAATCAAIATSARHAHVSELAGALDALFDW